MSTTTALTEIPDNKFKLDIGNKQEGIESPMLYYFTWIIMRFFMDKCKNWTIQFL